MQGVGAVVDAQLIGLPIYFEVACGDAVGIATGHLARARTIVEIVLDILVAQHHIGKVALTVGYFDAHDTGANRRERHTSSRLVDKSVNGDLALWRVDSFNKCFHASHLCAPSLMMTG